MTLPLRQTTIIEIDSAHSPLPLRLANALAAKIAADLGARVIKLEPPGGDPVRRLPPFLGDSRESALFHFLNTNKHSLVLPAAPATALERLLSGKADAVLAEAGEPGLAMARSRGLATVEIAGWPSGVQDPRPRLSEFTALALGGLLHMIGDPQRAPLRLGGHQAAYATGLAAFSALMALLAARDVKAPLAPARVSLVETVFWVNWKAVSGAEADGRSPARLGAASEFQVVRCQDGYVAVIFAINQFDALCDLVGDPRLRDARFATRASRRQHADALYRILTPWFAARTREDIYTQAQTRQIPLGPVYAPADLLDDPQYVARDFLAAMAHPTLGTLRLPKLPVQWNGHGFAPAPLAQLGGEA